MTHLDMLIPPTGLASALRDRHVTRKQHPHLPLSILTYAPICQYENLWNDVTMRCRGLVVDDDSGMIVALPFPKIFVTTMHNHGLAFAPPLPAEPFEVFEKADGSLAIVFNYRGKWYAASKGSFISGQAQWAQAVLDRSDTSRLDPTLTYLAEMIFPGNRIVLDYGTREDLVLLAAFRPADLGEVALEEAGRHWEPIGSTVRTWGLSDSVEALEQLVAANNTVDGDHVSGIEAEGYVIRFASGLRAKVKLADYLKIHALFTGTNERTVWEVLASGNDPADLFDQVPDEFRDWAHRVADKMRAQVSDWIAKATAAYQEIGHLNERKEFALRAVNSPYRAALFRLYEGRDITALAWKEVRPRGDASPYNSGDEG